MKNAEKKYAPRAGVDFISYKKPMQHKEVDYHWRSGIENIHYLAKNPDVKTILVTGSKNRKDDGVYKKTWLGWNRLGAGLVLKLMAIVLFLAVLITAMYFIFHKQ